MLNKLNSFFLILNIFSSEIFIDFEIIKGGDPTGTGRGGTSIYGGKL